MSDQTISQRKELRRAIKFNNHPRHLLGSKPVTPAAQYIALGLLDFFCVALVIWRCF